MVLGQGIVHGDLDCYITVSGGLSVAKYNITFAPSDPVELIDTKEKILINKLTRVFHLSRASAICHCPENANSNINYNEGYFRTERFGVVSTQAGDPTLSDAQEKFEYKE